MALSLSRRLNGPDQFSAEARGALYMILGMGAFALEDLAVKQASTAIPVGQAVVIYGLVGTLCFALFARLQGQRAVHPAVFSRVMLLRSLCEICGRLFYALALALTPLSNASAILQAAPVIVALGAILFFGEQVTLRKWLSILAGFIGVLLILRPGLDGFRSSAIFAVLGTIGFAGRDLATRAAPVSMTTAQIGVLGFSMLTLAGAVLLAFSGGGAMPDVATLSVLAAAMLFGMLGYCGLTLAMRTGRIASVSPFRYSRLLFALFLGVLLLDERPDVMSMIGSAIIVASGVIVLRERN
ncbi:DMT family transporter [Martelella lutilitoris]|uniref:DMT family transporter n=1 Tax=Martelella lutilitoris TaxID=2583532 RepID=A0A5C4JQ02_9HYPH|nr:DMT family transporter [Martelella lutilitoris]TNB47357.1 DMT family transporter [Martelella lutilitoris]